MHVGLLRFPSFLMLVSVCVLHRFGRYEKEYAKQVRGLAKYRAKKGE